MDNDNIDERKRLSLAQSAGEKRKRHDLETILSRGGNFTSEHGALPMGEHDPATAASKIRDAKVLVVGAGGLGCELLKDLACSGFRNIDVIDLDTIDVTNLNRQFLFRQKDVGSAKSEVAARFINERCPWMNVKAHMGKIQDKPLQWYKGFDVIISGLDNVEARRWLNGTVVGFVEVDEDGDPDPETIIPIIDGGTEGFRGQARVILPRITSCFECSLDAFPPQRTFPMCTIAETPRLPEHCISYAFMLQWPKEFPDKKLDKDNPTDMQWVYERAKERAEKYNIKGVTYMLTMGVVKNIIPAVASTNAVVAAACVNECVKLLSFASQTLNTYMMYMGAEGVYSHTFVYERKEECPVCQSKSRKVKMEKTATLNELIQSLVDGDLRLKKPSLVGTNTLYMQKPPALEAMTRPNRDKKLEELMASGEEITVTDEVLGGRSISLIVEFA
ncbi:hypothetical protein TrRE_jg921 [Triparma retinervis]|uniref:NEDD8-activating enzyme E1 catalytic subunit n=1 Tax=Triparma retinervis TaxID=2557542 RepID=A0A9W7A4E5_9STRA|nr:hypothetical protein TrRE_jg921 [Triparma retinervis]